MFFHRLAKSFRSQDWFTVVVELLVVMVGLVAAFQIDRWWEDRGGRLEEETYIHRLISDLEEDIPKLEYAVALAEVLMGFTDFLAEVNADPSVALDKPTYFLAASYKRRTPTHLAWRHTRLRICAPPETRS